MATHSSILVWRIPWTEKPGGLQSMASQRIRWDWSDLAGMHAHMNQRLCFESNHLLKGNQASEQCWPWQNIKLRPKQGACSCGLIYDFVFISRHQNYKNAWPFFFFLRYSTKSNCGVKCVPSKSPGNIRGTALIQRGSYYPSLTAITIFLVPTNKTQFWTPSIPKNSTISCIENDSSKLVFCQQICPGGGHGNPLQYSCLENPHGQGSLVGHSPKGHKESDTSEVT